MLSNSYNRKREKWHGAKRKIDSKKETLYALLYNILPIFVYTQM